MIIYVYILVYKLFWDSVDDKDSVGPARSPHTFVFNGYIVGAGVDKLLPRSADDLKCRTLLHYKTQNSTQLNSEHHLEISQRSLFCV